jgi:hypothetical protein
MSQGKPEEEIDEETCDVLDRMPWCGSHDLDQPSFTEELLNPNQLADYVHSLDTEEGGEHHAEEMALAMPRR